MFFVVLFYLEVKMELLLGISFVVVLFVLLMRFISRTIDEHLFKDNEEKGTNPNLYTVDNITLKGMHPILVEGRPRQQFYVDEIKSPYFFVKVFTYGGDALEGMPPIAFFTGWTEELPMNRFITYDSLFQMKRE